MPPRHLLGALPQFVLLKNANDGDLFITPRKTNDL